MTLAVDLYVHFSHIWFFELTLISGHFLVRWNESHNVRNDTWAGIADHNRISSGGKVRNASLSTIISYKSDHRECFSQNPVRAQVCTHIGI